MKIKQLIDEQMKEFDKKVSELRNANLETEEAVYFGFRYRTENDWIHNATDWGHVKCFMESYGRKLIEAVGEETK